MKNVIILHGTGENDTSFWFPWLKKKLEQKGYSVSIPLLPNADCPDLLAWLPVALKERYTSETILIGHSAGGPLQLSVLENLTIKSNKQYSLQGMHDQREKKKNQKKFYNICMIGKKLEIMQKKLSLLIPTMTPGDAMTSKEDICWIILKPPAN